jgi:hypothetical protein
MMGKDVVGFSCQISVIDRIESSMGKGENGGFCFYFCVAFGWCSAWLAWKRVKRLL